MIEFDLERAKNGDNITTRSGKPVRLFYFDLANKRGHKILGVIVEPSGMETIVTWAPDGAYCKERYANANDLVMAPKRVAKYYNVYKEGLGLFHDTREEAVTEAVNKSSSYIETREVTWEE